MSCSPTSIDLSPNARMDSTKITAPATIVAGAVILVEAMKAFGLDEIEVGEHDILYGAALANARQLDGLEYR